MMRRTFSWLKVWIANWPLMENAFLILLYIFLCLFNIIIYFPTKMSWNALGL
jgi:hypothetical protein